MKRLALVALLAAALGGCGAATSSTKPTPTPTLEFNDEITFSVGPISQTTSHQIAKLSRVASALAGHPTVVDCWSNEDWTRLAAWDATHGAYDQVDAAGFETGRRIQLSPSGCGDLQQTLARSANQPLVEAKAIELLAHEAAHASGISAEGLAECRAISTEPRAAELLGLSTTEGRRFQHIYRGTIYPYNDLDYRTPYCHAGLPGLVVPDTIGTSNAFRPLRRTTAAVVRVGGLPHWEDRKGATIVGRFPMCIPVPDRKLESARYGTTMFQGVDSRFRELAVSSARLRTRRVFADALVRFRAEPRCWLAHERTYIRESKAAESAVAAPMPRAITQLSPKVRAFRERRSANCDNGGLNWCPVTWNEDRIYIFDRATLTLTTLVYRVPTGKAPLAYEVRAVKAALRTLR